MNNNYFRVILLLLIFIASGFFAVGKSYALDDRLLILPPKILGENTCNYPITAERWQKTIEVYNRAVVGVEVVQGEEFISKTNGDTIQYDILSIDAAVQWGMELEADMVILTEWYCEDGGGVRLQQVDPWDAELLSMSDESDLLNAIHSAELDRWIHGVYPIENLQQFTPPHLKDGPKAIHYYLHRTGKYPPEAAIQMVSGRIRARVIVSGDGIPLKVYPPEVNPRGWEFEKPIEQALWELPYEAATLDGKPVIGLYEKELKVHFGP
ncbi:hypothetical protein K8I28_01260 [bacterium]|nr:hypothetical protein [bacterium]